MATTPKPIMDAEKTIRALAQEYVRHYNARDFDKLVNLLPKTVVSSLPTIHLPKERLRCARRYNSSSLNTICMT